MPCGSHGKPVGVRFKRNLKFLETLRKEKSAQRRLNFIQKANPNQIFAIMDAANNILNGSFEINKSQKQRLIPYRDILRDLGRARSHAKAVNIIQRGRGMFLPALLAPILSELGVYLIKSAIKKFRESKS